MESTTSPALENKLKVLIADDDPPTRILLRAAISQWGYEVIEASDGEEAWGLVQGQTPPQMLIVDWLMPKLDGIELCEKILKSHILKPYIILLTQVSGTTNIIRGLEAGADEFLSKPFNLAELRSRLAVGAKIINHQTELQNYVFKVDELITKLLNASLEISALLEEINYKQENVSQIKNNLTQISNLNTNLSEVIDTLKKFNLSYK